jgi:hypothetical protein
LRRYSLILLILCAVFSAGLEFVARYWLPRVGSVQGRLDREHTRADEIRPVPGKPVPVLSVGNSLMQKGINFNLLNEKLNPEFAVTRYVVEDTNYLDWYYGLRRLFREGARPKVVILVLNARQLLAPNVQGDAFAELLMDSHDLLKVKQNIASDNTVTSNLLFANLSRYYGVRSEVHKWFLLRLLPEFPALAARLRPPNRPLAADEEIEKEATERLQRMSSLCAEYGAQFVFVVPPSAAARDGSSAIQRAGNRSGIPVLVPIQPQELPLDLYSDGFHLNYRGARIFTQALSSSLRQALRKDNFLQSARSSETIGGSVISLSVAQPSQ